MNVSVRRVSVIIEPVAGCSTIPCRVCLRDCSWDVNYAFVAARAPLQELPHTSLQPRTTHHLGTRLASHDQWDASCAVLQIPPCKAVAAP